MLKTLARVKLLRRVRPTLLVSPVLTLLRERKIVDVEGLRIFIDPTSHLGHEILSTGSYERETVRIFREQIRPGDIVLDIGANEGFFSALAADLTGEDGLVLAVEPQSRLMDVLEINLALNSRGPVRIVKNVVGESDSEVFKIALFPMSNTGASSVVRKYRLGSNSEDVAGITPATIMEQAGVDRFDFVKIDVEGFEPEVVRAMAPLLDRKVVRTILLDYHRAILEARGVAAEPTHALILAKGYRPLAGSVGDGYVLYERN